MKTYLLPEKHYHTKVMHYSKSSKYSGKDRKKIKFTQTCCNTQKTNTVPCYQGQHLRSGKTWTRQDPFHSWPCGNTAECALNLSTVHMRLPRHDTQFNSAHGELVIPTHKTAQRVVLTSTNCNRGQTRTAACPSQKANGRCYSTGCKWSGLWDCEVAAPSSWTSSCSKQNIKIEQQHHNEAKIITRSSSFSVHTMQTIKWTCPSQRRTNNFTCKYKT